jgi:hypothetical protein
MIRIGIILGGARPNRNGPQVAPWVLNSASRRGDRHATALNTLLDQGQS